MNQITKYQCVICEAIYDTEEEGQKCEARGVQPGRFLVGESVYMLHRYPNDPNRPFGHRTITKVLSKNRHTPDYVFNKPFHYGKELWIGDTESHWPVDSYRQASEYLDSLYKIGDKISKSYLLPADTLTVEFVDYDL